MWARINEWCADIFGLTMRGRLVGLTLTIAGLFALCLLLGVRWGLDGFVPPAVLFGALIGAALQVAGARRQLWRTSCLGLGDGAQPPSWAGGTNALAPTTLALRRLAEAVDAVRRGRYAAANELVPNIDRSLLREEEGRLYEAARAMISLGLGDGKRAAQQAIVALPTGSEELDSCLGRAVVADAWSNPDRLRAIDSAWGEAGVDTGHTSSLGRLQRLVRVRVDLSALDLVDGSEARLLSDEARAVGDDDLAAELEARGRPTAYR